MDLPDTQFALDALDAASLHARFTAAAPFSHLVLDDVLRTDPAAVTAAFPPPGWDGWVRFTDAYQHQKCACGRIDLLPPLFRAMVQELSAPRFLAFLEQLTGIPALLPDPYLTGGGLHSSGPGGVLAPHADFHAYERLCLFRRINVLVYFNPGWQAEHGGALQLFGPDAARAEVSIVPVFGRMVIFLTDDRSIHGFTEPVAHPQSWRNSLALYYYTAEDTENFIGDGVTYWKAHGRQRGLNAARLLGYKALLHGSWTLARLAHRLNPNMAGRRK